MLIVEGPDGAGKTTLVKQLEAALGWPVNPQVVASDTTIETSLKKWVEHNVKRGFQERIFDRHCLISEPIYGPIVRNELQGGFDDPNWFAGAWDQFIRARPIVIFCLPPLAIVQANLHKTHQPALVRQRIHLIYHGYWAMYCRFPGMRARYDYTSPVYSLSQLVNIAQAGSRKVPA